jgi:hypothetical protein
LEGNIDIDLEEMGSDDLNGFISLRRGSSDGLVDQSNCQLLKKGPLRG